MNETARSRDSGSCRFPHPGPVPSRGINHVLESRPTQQWSGLLAPFTRCLVIGCDCVWPHGVVQDATAAADFVPAVTGLMSIARKATPFLPFCAQGIACNSIGVTAAPTATFGG